MAITIPTSPDDKLRFYRGWAAFAVHYTKQVVSLGATDDASNTSLLGAGLASIAITPGEWMAGGVDWARGCTDKLTEIRRMAFYTKVRHAGNCGNQAAVAFTYLYDNGVLPLAFLYRDNHAFVLLGQDSIRAQWEDPGSWPAYSVIADPWKGFFYPGRCHMQYEQQSPEPYFIATL